MGSCQETGRPCVGAPQPARACALSIPGALGGHRCPGRACGPHNASCIMAIALLCACGGGGGVNTQGVQATSPGNLFRSGALGMKAEGAVCLQSSAYKKGPAHTLVTARQWHTKTKQGGPTCTTVFPIYYLQLGHAHAPVRKPIARRRCASIY